ncbi:hypothetical protein [Sphingobium yanoikuyae]|uniref:hypothetical protein n=1 Tax=Sphingobium yanoikuyae TaxID=13690 RepID=UPI0035B3852D
MSSIAFHSPSDTLRISGRERAAMGIMCADQLKTQFGSMRFEDHELLRSIMPAGHYLQDSIKRMEAGELGSGPRFESDFDTYIRVGDAPLWIDGEPYDLFSLQLNSAVSWGNRAVQLAAKLHGQCEIHAFCEGKHRAWMADIIAEGIECRVFRDLPMGYHGWSQVVEFLRSNDQEPVVTSYSVCESFPGPHCAPADMDMGDDPWEAWDALSDDERWQIGLAHVRAEPSLEISPERLGKRFNHALSGRDFMDLARAKLKERTEA